MGPRPIVTVAVCALAALCARASGCATADCAIDIYCEAGSLIGVGVGFYSPAGNCGRFACTNKRSACTPSQWRNAAMSYTAYTTSGGGIDSCSWACAPGGHYLEIGYNPQFDCQACKPAWPGYYSPPLDNELYECPAPVGQGTLTDKEGNDSAECEVDCSGASPPYVENDRAGPGALTPTPGGDYTCTSTISVVDDEVQSAGEAPSNELSTDMPPKKLAV
ncbi:hypothetical protein KFE25_008193 [Diacronema lutheri]|uniref:Cellulase n=1 Tax=Diacronema lutheri TaxID=2081491 RepID=A0A8J5XND1_DIALT|nr:hypothetical protein KFE25_008193 [Diacronema lutheri]